MVLWCHLCQQSDAHAASLLLSLLYKTGRKNRMDKLVGRDKDIGIS